MASMFVCKLLLLSFTMIARGFADISEGTWLDAFTSCNQLGLQLPLYSHEIKQGLDNDWTTSNKSYRIWVGIHQKRFRNFRWLDGTAADPAFSKQDWKSYDCGVFHLRGRAKEATDCTETNLGYICEGKAGNKSCGDRLGLGVECTTIDNRIFIYGCGANNWFDARIKCIKNGMDLALLKSKKILLQLHTKWYSRRVTCNKAWIGLRRSDWITTRNHGPILQSSWAPGEPSGKGSCVVFTLRGDHNVHRWYTERCDAVNTWFCSDFRVPITIATKSTASISGETAEISQVTRAQISTEAPTNLDPVTGSNAALIAVMIILVIIATGAIVIVLLYRRRQKRRKQSSKYDEDASLVTMENSDDVKLMLPNSEISLMSLGRLGPVSNILKINATMKPGFHIPDTEKLLTPIVNVFCGGHESNDTLNLRDQLELVIPHKLNIPCAEKYIIVYTSKVGCKDWEKLDTGPDREGMQQISAVIENDHILVCFDFPIAVMCTCISEVIPALNLTAVLFYKYYKEESLQEMNVKLYFVDSLYTISDCIRTLEDERYSYEIVHVKASAVQGKCGTEKIKIDFGADDGWNVKHYDETGTENQELKDLQPTSQDPVGVQAGNWFVQRNDKKDSLKINLRVYVPEGNDVLCEHVHHFYPLMYEDKYEQETSDKQPASSR